MAWPKRKQIEAERRWFRETADFVASECNGSVISGRRTRAHQAELRKQGLNPSPTSLHLQGLAEDQEYDTDADFARAWGMGRQLGLHGYQKPKHRVIHWQSRPAKKKAA